MAEQKITQHLLANPVQGKREKDARFEALLAAIKKAINSNKPFNVTQDEEIIDMKAIISYDIKSFPKLFDDEIIDRKAINSNKPFNVVACYQISTVNKD